MSVMVVLRKHKRSRCHQPLDLGNGFKVAAFDLPFRSISVSETIKIDGMKDQLYFSLVEQGEEHIDGKEQNNAPFIAEENENVPSVTTEDWNGILKGLGFDISLAQLAEKNLYLQQASRVVENVVEDNLVEAEEEICILSIQELCDVLEAVSKAVALGSDNITEKELIQLLKVTEKLRKASEKVGAAEEAKVFVGRAEDNGPPVQQIPTQKWNEDFEWSDSNSSNIADEDLAQSAEKGEKFEQSSEMAEMLKQSGEDTRNLVNEEPAPSEKSKGNSNEEVAQSVQECDELKQALETIKEVNLEENFERKGVKETENRTFSSIYDKKNRPKKVVQNTCKKRKKDDHKCNETMCTLCKKYVDFENHLCFVPQPPTKKKIENARNGNANALKDITQHITYK